MHNLAGLWPEFVERYEAADASLNTYRQKFDLFKKWLDARNAAPARDAGGAGPVVTMEGVTRETAEEYARYIFKRKSTAKKDIETLRRIWDTMLPDQECNPWRIGLHLRPAQPKMPCNYRPLAADEARRFVRAALRAAERSGGQGGSRDARYSTGAEKFLDIADAAVFAWHYGMRMGSLVSLNWRDLATWRRGFFLHVPPKTRYTKPWPLELPVVAEARAVIEARVETAPRGRGDDAPLFPALAAEYRRSQANLTVSIKCLFKEAGIADTRRGRAQMHSFRASFITQMDEAGAPSGITNAVTGHAPRNMHDVYSHPRPAALKRWIDRAIPDIGS